MAGMNEAATIADEKKEQIHPLMKFVPTDYSIEEWLARWNETKHLADRLGLLHHLTTQDGWFQYPELVSLLLDFADGYRCLSNFYNREESYYHRHEIAKKRQVIAKKAFEVLCLRFFREGKDGGCPFWWWILKNEALFNKALWFLSVKDYNNRLRNLDFHFDISSAEDRHQETFRIFARRFARLGWDFPANCHLDPVVGKRIVDSKPQFIDVLCALGELQWLNTQDLDKACLDKLTKLALEQSIRLPQETVSDTRYSRQPKSLEEAVLGCSVAAQVVLLYRIREREQNRIKATYEKSVRQKKETDRQILVANLQAQAAAIDLQAKRLSEQ